MLYPLLERFKRIVKDSHVRKFRTYSYAHELVLEIRFINDSILFVKDYVFLDNSRKYAYHWQDKDGRLIVRWDNAPHWKDIKSFPHHQHIGDLSNIEPTQTRNLEDAFFEIEKVIKGKRT